MTEAKQDTEKTNQFKQLYEYFKKNIKEIVLLINAVGFVNYFIYYKSFGIPIFNYVGLNDIIFFVLEYVLAIVLVILLVEFILNLIFYTILEWFFKLSSMFKKSEKDIDELSEEDKEKADDKQFAKVQEKTTSIKVKLILIGVFFILILPIKSITIPAYFVYLTYLVALELKRSPDNFSITAISIVIVVGLLVTSVFDIVDKRDEKQDYTISFVENGQLITTEKGESTLNYIGESSEAIFLYDIEREEARIYDKSNISDIRIQSNEMLEVVEDYIKSTSIYNLYFGDKQP